MEIATMGKIQVPARIENLFDVQRAEAGMLGFEQVRSLEVPDALLDTGATILSLPRRLIQQLGLRRLHTRKARTTAGVVSLGICEPVRLTVQERDCEIRVAEIPDECPVLIGVLALESLDFVVDAISQRLIGNPEHGGEPMIEMF